MISKVQIVDSLGEQSFLQLKKIAFLCSRKISAQAVLKCYDWAIEQREAGNCVISGFHSPIEKDVFKYLAKGEQPIILVLPRGLKKKWEPEVRKLLRSDQFLILTPFTSNITRITKATSYKRNELMFELADEIVIGYKSRDSSFKHLLEDICTSKISYLG